MDTNQGGENKRPKRPRIGSGADNNPANSSPTDSRFERVHYGSKENRNSGETSGEYVRQQRPYQPRPRYNQYNRQDQGDGNGYQPGGPRYNQYNRRPQQQDDEGGYQPRPRYNQNRSGYNNDNGYQPRPRYNQYNRRPQQQDDESGYQPRPRYNQNGGDYRQRQGGYNQRPGNRYNNRQQQGPKRPGKSFVPRPKRIEYEQPEVDPNTEVRLNKFIANAGICSRREADEFIQRGVIKVNGNVVTELGTKITGKDLVEFNDRVVTAERKCYVLLNKPKDCVTTADDPNGRLTVMDLVKNACEERIYPVGRLDRNTTGVLLLTNDGDLASKLTHPQYVKKKIYHVWTDRDISEDDMQRIADGIELDDGPIHADAISYATDTDRNQAGIEIHSGRNRIVRRIFESLGYHVTKLDRVYFAGLTKKNLPRGRWRYLTQEEVNFLKMGSFE